MSQMTEKQKAAFERSDARRAAQGLPPIRLTSRPYTIGQMAASAGKCAGMAAVAAVTGGPVLASLSLLAARLAACDDCPLLVAGYCRKCRCPTPVATKARLIAAECPEGLWPPVEVSQT